MAIRPITGKMAHSRCEVDLVGLGPWSKPVQLCLPLSLVDIVNFNSDLDSRELCELDKTTSTYP
jgi:hypothetical protein